jgi:hypothetical protein
LKDRFLRSKLRQLCGLWFALIPSCLLASGCALLDSERPTLGLVAVAPDRPAYQLVQTVDAGFAVTDVPASGPTAASPALRTKGPLSAINRQVSAYRTDGGLIDVHDERSGHGAGAQTAGAFERHVEPESRAADGLPTQVAQVPSLGPTDVPRGETVRSRRRPELAPLGVRVGSFLVYPQLGITESYDDNIFADPSDEVDDFITRVIPELRIQSNWENHSLRLNSHATFGIYGQNSDEDYQDYGFEGDLRIDVTSESSIEVSADFSHEHESRTSPDDVRGTEPTEFDDVTGALAFFQRLGRVNAMLGVDVERLDYDDVPAVGGTNNTINNDDRDRLIYAGKAWLGYEIVPQYEAFVRGAYDATRYDTTPDDNGFDRDAEGFDVGAGIAIDFGGLVFGDFFLGYGETRYDDSRLAKIDGMVFDAEITWNVTGLTTVVGAFERDIRSTTISGASGSFLTRLALSVDHELLRNLLLKLNAKWTMQDFEGINRTDDTYRVGFGAEYLMNRFVYVTVDYAYEDRTSDQLSAEFTENIVLLGLEFHY